MATETDLVDLFDSLAERAPSVHDVLDRMLPARDRAPRPSRPWVPVVAAVAAAAAVAVSVVILRGDDSRSGDAAGPPPVVDQASYAMPLDRYHASVAQTLTIERAEFALVQRCAQQHGVALPSATFHADEATSFLISLANNIRPLTAQQAHAYVYGFPSHDSSTVNSAVDALTPSQREIVTGWQRGGKSARPSDQFLLRGGCFGQADRTLLAGAIPPPIPNLGTIPAGGHTLFDDDVNVHNTYVNLGYPGNLTAPVQQAQRRWGIYPVRTLLRPGSVAPTILVGLHCGQKFLTDDPELRACCPDDLGQASSRLGHAAALNRCLALPRRSWPESASASWH